MISVVIPDCQDGLYLIRCVNSIKRQTYTDIEIIAVWNENSDIKKIDGVTNLVREMENSETIKSICAIAKGEWIFFTSYFTVLSPNSLKELFYQSNDKVITIINEVNTNSNRDDYDCVYLHCLSGKLLKKNLLIKEIPPEDDYYLDYEIWERYKANFKEVNLSENAYCYYSISDDLELKKINYDKEKFVNTLFYIRKLDDKSRDSLERYLVYKINYEDSIENVCDDICEYACDSYYLMMNVVVNHYKVLYEDECKNLNRKEYERVKKFLVGLDDEVELQELALKKFNISQEMFSAMKRLEYRNYRYVVQNNALFVATVYPNGIQNLMGPQLAEYMISKYMQGQLGAGTLIKCFIGWLKYKMKRN
jgi:glycosyltransferase involved in cell wall biosynthesis